MNIINKLTYRHLKSNMKRTILTLCGIIISVAMVSAVFTSAISFMNFLKNMATAYEGNWYAKYEECSLSDMKTLKGQGDVELVSVTSGIAHIDNDKTSSSSKTETDLVAVEGDYFDMFDIQLSSGAVPKNANEIVMSKTFMDNCGLNLKVGDTVTLATSSYGDDTEEPEYKDVTYTLCGITESVNSRTEYNAVITAATPKNTVDGSYTVYVKNDKLDNSVWDKIKNDASSIGKKDCDSTNEELFWYSGIIKDNSVLIALGSFVAIILVIIIIASVFMIYDSFAVSFQQRSRYLGMLASVGATRRQKRHSIYYEGFLLGIVGIPLGILAGIGGIAVTFKGIEKPLLSTFAIPVYDKLTVHISPLVVIGSVFVSAFTIFISAYIPARKASKTTAIDAIRQNNTVTVKGSRLKSSKVMTKLFGYEGALATKNFKRNGKRSRNIVLALSMSIVLFLTVTNFSTMFTNMMSSEFGGLKYDIYTTIDCNDINTFESAVSTVDGIDSIDGYVMSNAKMDNMAKYAGEDGTKYAGSLSNGLDGIVVYAMDSNCFNEYAKELHLDTAPYYDAKSPQGILLNSTTLHNSNGKKRNQIEIYSSDVSGKMLSGSGKYFNRDTNKDDYEQFSITVGKVTNQEPKNVRIYTDSYSATLIIPVDTYKSLLPKVAENSSMSYGIVAADHEKVYSAIEEATSKANIMYTGYDSTSQMESLTAIATIAKVFGFGFITLITLISIMNIINTISTSMEERRREFAMIKSVGLTPKSFNKMIYLESIMYGVKSLLWGIPISLVLNILMFKALGNVFDYGFTIHWSYYVIAVVAVFAVVMMALIYSTSKIKNDNIIETLKSDDI